MTALINNDIKLVLYPDKILETKCKPVDKVTPELKQLAMDMYKFMKKNNGVGLAANQIGKNIELIVIDNNGVPIVMFNPKILLQSSPKYLNEACLSFPGKQLKIKRPQKITVLYVDLNNRKILKEFKKFTAHIICHEIDHIRGLTMLDRVKKQTKFDKTDK